MITFTRDPWENPGLERILRAEGWRVTVKGKYMKAMKAGKSLKGGKGGSSIEGSKYNNSSGGVRRNLLIWARYDHCIGLYFVGYSDSHRTYLYNFTDSPSGRRNFHRIFYGQLMHDAGVESSKSF